MYGIFTYTFGCFFVVNVGKYTIHRSYGFYGLPGQGFCLRQLTLFFFLPTASEATHIVVGNGSFGFGMNGEDVSGWKRIRHGERIDGHRHSQIRWRFGYGASDD